MEYCFIPSGQTWQVGKSPIFRGRWLGISSKYMGKRRVSLGKAAPQRQISTANVGANHPKQGVTWLSWSCHKMSCQLIICIEISKMIFEYFWYVAQWWVAATIEESVVTSWNHDPGESAPASTENIWEPHGTQLTGLSHSTSRNGSTMAHH